MKSPAFSFYVRDWLCSNMVSKLHSKAYSKDGSNMASRCLNAYLFLLIQSWLQEPVGTLPADDEELAQLARVTPDEWKLIKPLISPSFKVGTDGRWFNERLMVEVYKQQIRSKAGSKGGSTKQAKRVAALEDAIEDENENEDSKKQLMQKQAELIYAAYPLKVGRPKAIQAILKAMSKCPPDELLAITKRFAEVRGADMAFIAHPSTWFNQERFNDDPATWSRNEPELNLPKVKPLEVSIIERI